MKRSLKAIGQSLLRRAGLYHRIKSSAAYDLYWRFANPRLLTEMEEEIDFFRRTLSGFRPNDLIFDIGANQGHKTHIFLRLGARVVAVDPDKTNQEILRQNFLSYRLTKKPVVIVGKAVSDRAGAATMWVNEPGSAKNTLNSKWVEALATDASRFGSTLQFEEKVEVETVTLNDLIAEHGRPFYIKIDVEGHEPSALRGLQTAVPFVSFEVNLPEFHLESAECVRRLAELSAAVRFNYTVDCRSGMALPEWEPAGEFLQRLGDCGEPSIEVFARSID